MLALIELNRISLKKLRLNITPFAGVSIKAVSGQLGSIRSLTAISLANRQFLMFGFDPAANFRVQPPIIPLAAAYGKKF